MTAILAVVAQAAPVGASCAPPRPLAQSLPEADVVFVGRVLATTNARRWATVQVEEIWKGRGVAATVEVRGGPADPPGPANVASSVDTFYRAGRRYLFVPYNRPAPYRDNACTPTRPFGPGAERFRPADAVFLTGDGGSDDPIPAPTSTRPWIPVALGAGLLTGAGVWMVRRSRRGAA